jgi:hypothetical protein
VASAQYAGRKLRPPDPGGREQCGQDCLWRLMTAAMFARSAARIVAKFERIQFDPGAWEKTLNGFADRIVFQTPAWLAFVAETQKGQIVLAALKEGDEILGYFSGVMIKKFGLKILGSPFRGWSSPYMGFNLNPTVPRRVAAAAMPEFAFRELGCIHFEIVDPQMHPGDIQGLGFAHERHATLEVDLTQDEKALFDNMHNVCRRNIRQAERRGVIIEEAHDPAFADEYAAQLKDVFAKQGLVPNYGAARVRALIEHLQPTGALLLLRARAPEGRCIATGIYPALNRTAYYWGGASWREHQTLRPNEMLHWSAMRHWKRRGIQSYNMVGTMGFKQKFGGQETSVAMISGSRYRWLSRLRSVAPQIGRAVLHMIWKLKPSPKAKTEENDE